MIIKGGRIILVACILVLLCQVLDVSAAETGPDTSSQTAGESVEVTNIPDLAEIVPLEVKLTSRLKALESQLQGGLDIAALENRYAEIGADFDELSETLQQSKKSEVYKYNKLVDLREVAKQKSADFAGVNRPVTQLIRRLDSLRKEWQSEATRWDEWQASLLSDGGFEQLRPIFMEAAETIDSALDQLLSRLELLLTVQEKAGKIERKISEFSLELESQLTDQRRNALFSDAPPLFSSAFFAQLKSSGLWNEVLKMVDDIALPGSTAISQHGWVPVVYLFLSLAFIAAFRKRKAVFEGSERWRFLSLYPGASGWFLGYMVCVLIYEYQGVPGAWKVSVEIIAVISFARLMVGVVDAEWKNKYIQGFILVFITTRLMDVLSFPLLVFRLYIFIAAIISLCFCLYLARESVRVKTRRLYLWMFNSGALFFAVIIIAEILGKKAWPSYLFVSLIHSLATILVVSMFMYIISGVVEFLFKTTALRRSTAMSEDDTKNIINRLAHFLNTLVIVLALVPAILMIWGFFESLGDATTGVLSFGITVVNHRLTVGLLVVSASILYASFIFSWMVQKILVDELLFNRRMEKAARISIARLVNYFIIVVGFLVALSALGIEVSKITIMLSALGVGIGFGLQGIVNNFVSGLVLLFEQPVRVGDLVEIDGMWAEIKNIGIRATMVRNFEHADMIIPNADLVSNQVTNWTLGDRQARLKIAVGVAYGSEVNLVMETLLACAEDNKRVSKAPNPEALFLNFGESSLDFELRVFVSASMRMGIRSELHQEIDKRFREKNITIAFPQRDIHLPGVTTGGSTDNNELLHAAVDKDDGS